MQVDPNLTLDKAKWEVWQREAVREQQGVLKGDQGKTVDSVRRPNRPSWKSTSRASKNLPTGSPKSRPSLSSRCQRCGKGSHPKQSCPASLAVCHNCKKKGHFSSMYFSKAVSSVATSHNDKFIKDYLEISYLNTVTSNSTQIWNCVVLVDGVEVPFKIDTGAEVTVVTEAVGDSLNRTLKSTQRILYWPDKKPLSVLGKLAVSLQYRGRRSTQPVYVVEGLQENLLGLPAIQNLRILPLPHNLYTITQSIVEQYSSLSLGTFDEGYSIKLRPNSRTFSLFVTRNVPLPLRKKVQEELRRMEQLGVISKVNTLTDWCTGMVVVPKKSGDVRICVDFVRLMKVLKGRLIPCQL